VKRAIRPIKEFHIRYPAILNVLFGIFIGSLLPNLVTIIMTNTIGVIESLELTLLIITFGLIIPPYIYILYERRKIREHKIEGKDYPERRKGLIVIVSKKETAITAIKYHNPKICWLIATRETKRTCNEIEKLFPNVVFERRMVKDTYNPFECYHIIRGIYQSDLHRFKLKPEDVIVDITGGTKPMSIGATLACIDMNLAIEYIPAYYGTDLSPKRPLSPIEIRTEH